MSIDGSLWVFVGLVAVFLLVVSRLPAALSKFICSVYVAAERVRAARLHYESQPQPTSIPGLGELESRAALKEIPSVEE